MQVLKSMAGTHWTRSKTCLSTHARITNIHQHPPFIPNLILAPCALALRLFAGGVSFLDVDGTPFIMFEHDEDVSLTSAVLNEHTVRRSDPTPTITILGAPKSIGCYLDQVVTATEAAGAAPGGNTWSHSMWADRALPYVELIKANSIQDCAAVASSHGSLFFGMEAGSECW